MRVFIAGVMQGSRLDDRVTDQAYRATISRLLEEHVPGVRIVDPWTLHPESESYGVERARKTFLEMSEVAGRADVLVAYLPEASMGTAIEMWEAHRNGAQVLTISPMAANWVVKLLSSRVFPSLEAFGAFVEQGGLRQASRRRRDV
jgi:hypothetical protein